MPDLPQCLDCGTCCFSNLENYVRVTGDDHQRLGDLADELVHFDANRAYMRMVDGHCAALQVHAATRQFICRAYEVRPQICRDLQRGSAECLGELDLKGSRPKAALRLALLALP